MLRSILKSNIRDLLSRNREWQPYLREQHRQICTTRDNHLVVKTDIPTRRPHVHIRLRFTDIHHLDTRLNFSSRIPRKRQLRLDNLATSQKSSIRMEHNHFIIRKAKCGKALHRIAGWHHRMRNTRTRQGCDRGIQLWMAIRSKGNPSALDHQVAPGLFTKVFPQWKRSCHQVCIEGIRIGVADNPRVAMTGPTPMADFKALVARNFVASIRKEAKRRRARATKSNHRDVH